MTHSNTRVYRELLLCAFLGFLDYQISLLIHSFDPFKQFSGGDVIFDKTRVTLLLKWSKTLQDRDQVRTIVLPKLKVSHICPF